MNCKDMKLNKNIILSFVLTSKVMDTILQIELYTYPISFSYVCIYYLCMYVLLQNTNHVNYHNK